MHCERAVRLLQNLALGAGGLSLIRILDRVQRCRLREGTEPQLQTPIVSDLMDYVDISMVTEPQSVFGADTFGL